MIADPSSLLALLFSVGILSLLVLVLPLLILFWSEVEPQLAGLFGSDQNSSAPDEYGSQAVLPRLMKSFGNIAEQENATAGTAKRTRAKSGGTKTKAKAKPKTSGKATTGKPATRAKKTTTKRKTARKTTARSKAGSSRTKTVKAAPTKAKSKTTASAKSKPKTKAKSASTSAATSRAKAKPKSSAASAKTRANSKPKAAASSTSKAKPKSSSRTPAGAKRLPVLGVIYTKKPKEADDLKQIKGVAKVIESKLHTEGIYTYRQIADWDSAAIDAFSDKLSFKGRIRNEDWQKQCGKLHKEKYGENI